MSRQLFEITRAPEVYELKEDFLLYLLNKARIDTEWGVRERTGVLLELAEAKAEIKKLKNQLKDKH